MVVVVVVVMMVLVMMVVVMVVVSGLVFMEAMLVLRRSCIRAGHAEDRHREC
jgi:hypothetical protein